MEDKFEQLSAKYVAAVAQSMDENNMSVVFSSPLSARSPDLCFLWHTGYRKKYFMKLTTQVLFSLPLEFIKGLIKLFSNFKPLGYILQGKIDDKILVIPLSCTKLDNNGKYQNQYISTEEDDAVFIFGPKSSLKGREVKEIKITFKEKLLLLYKLLRGGGVAFFNTKGKVADRLLIFMSWMLWILGFKWIDDYRLDRSLSHVVEEYEIRKIGCIHEMHNYARIVWRVKYRYGLKGYTVQHAAVASGKRWYFCHPEEKDSGLMLPDIMYIYNNKVKDLLKPYYSNTQFILGCSYRYSGWRNVNGRKHNKGKYYLFVGALAGFDNDVLFSSLRHLLKATKETISLRIRLHPLAILNQNDKIWLENNIKNGIIHVSKDVSLKQDIEDAIAVIGMSTTVLEEALLMGCPVIQLQHPDYLQYIDIDGLQGASKIDYDRLSFDDLMSVANAQPNPHEIREKLGLDHSLVTYKSMFING